MVPLQHNVLLESIDVVQTNAIESLVSLTLNNIGTSSSPADAVTVAMYVSGQPDSSLSTATLISSANLPAIKSSDSYPTI